MLMLNYILAIELILYIVTLIVGFNIKKADKDKHNKLYHKYKYPLYFMIFSIFTYSLALIFIVSQSISWLYYLFAIEVLFMFYFFGYVNSQTRCWKQHRMVLFNFLIIPVVYFCSLALENTLYTIPLIIIIYIYNILEFQFAKFNLTQPLIWD